MPKNEKGKANEKRWSPMNDYCFKRLFGHKGNEKITQGLLESILECKCDIVEVKSDEVTEKDLASDKVGVLDVYVKQRDGTGINIEMQMVTQDTILKRVLFYWSKKYIESIETGKDYIELKPTKVILITNFEIEKLKELKQIISKFKIIEEKTRKLILTNDFELVIIELPKLLKYSNENKKVTNWMKFLTDPNQVGDDVMENDESLKQAKEEYNKIIADEHERALIRLREKYILDQNTLKRESYESGQKDGIKQGIKQGIEQGIKQGENKEKIKIAKKLLSLNTSIEDIINITELTEKEILDLLHAK